MLSLSQPVALRQCLAQALTQQATTELCWHLGQQASSPSVAFFIGYQAAMRCLDADLAPLVWAALAVSERGMKNPFHCQSVFNAETGQLVGQKSHVMLAATELDQLYVLAKLANVEPAQLVLVQVEVRALDVAPASAQKFMTDVAHHSVSFDLVVPPTALFCLDAHHTANKPFRYWEDVHVLLALAGWLQAQLNAPSHEITDAAAALMKVFQLNPKHYSLAALMQLDELWRVLQQQSAQLSDNASMQWQQDSQLWLFTQPVRQAIRTKLNA